MNLRNDEYKIIEIKSNNVRKGFIFLQFNINNKFPSKFKVFSLLFIIIISYILGFISFSIIYKKEIKQEKLKTLNYLFSNFASYSQDFEDFILYYIFYDVANGFYIDVGAHDPNYLSVTKSFYDRGWSGINIDPLPHKYLLFKKYRPRDINLQIAVGNIEGYTNFKVYGLISSLFYSKKDNLTKIIKTPIKTMKNVCKIYVPKGINISFCKIDVESAEKYVLLGYDFINYRPNVFCVESLINKKTNIPEYKEWEEILIKNDYEFAYKFRRNRFYYDKRISNMKNKFNNLNYYIKKYFHTNRFKKHSL